MKVIGYFATLSVLLLPATLSAQAPTSRIRLGEKGVPVVRTLDKVFGSAGTPGWSIGIDLETSTLLPDVSLMSLTNQNKQKWLEWHMSGPVGEQRLEFLLYTDYRSEPLSVGIPVKLLTPAYKGTFLLRYEGFRLDLFYAGVLVDEEWPIGTVKIGEKPELQFSAPVAQVSIWNSALSDAAITSKNGGSEKIAARTNTILGPEPTHIQYSRPRGYNTNAGDAMPFYHDGTFHLYFLLDRRQHHSKWGLGAHQWGHVSTTDLVHWTHYPVALPIEHDWEGSICTGSVFFHDGHYYAHYATRMPDRSERLGVAESEDGIHFRKTIPTPFAEPTSPYIHGPNRDPFVFQDGDEFHMLITAAVAKGDASEGALEHLVSKDLSAWAVAKQPFLLAGSPSQPECSDLFKWRDWYYLIFSLGGTTHYRMSKTALGPWITPTSDILDGPEAIVMKAAEFKAARRIMVGFVQHDHLYGGDLVFRELLQEKDGSLGTTVPKEMELPGGAAKAAADMHLNEEKPTGQSIDVGTNARIAATITDSHSTSFTVNIGSSETGRIAEELIFDPASSTVIWTDTAGNPAHAKLEHVTDLDGPIDIVITLHETLADLSINGHRTLIHRLSSSQPRRISFSSKGGSVDVSQLTVSLLR